MRWWVQLRNSCRSLWRRRRSEAELENELRDHMAREVEQNVRAGMSEDEARFAAQRLVGPVTLYKEECRDTRGTAAAENIFRDVRYAVRMLRRTPLFTMAAMLTLGLSIGANTTVFTFVENIVLRQLPVRNPQQLAALNWGGMNNIAYPNYLDFRDRNKVFSELIACRLRAASINVQARESFRIWGYEASGNYFRALGVKPLLGRFFTPAEDDKPGAHPVLVISHRFWQSRFAGNPDVIGRAVKINGYPFTIVGVAPASFAGTELIVSSDFWVPINMETEVEAGSGWLRSRGSQNVWILGRVKPGVSWPQAETDLNRIALDLAQTYPNELDGKAKFRLTRPGLIGASLREPITAYGMVLTGVAATGLLLACINLAGMLLARAADRRREVGIRLALGAGKFQLLRQMMTESLVLAASGGVFGCALAFGACRLFNTWQPALDFPFSTTLKPDATVLCFAAAVSLGTAILFGLAPALQAIRTDVVPSLKNGPLFLMRRWNVRDLLVASQIALSVMLVICSVLMVRSLQNALKLNLGFAPKGAVAVSFDLKMQGYSQARSRRFDAELLRRVWAQPGVKAAGVINNLPLRLDDEDNEVVSRPDRPEPRPAERNAAIIYSISPGYLCAAGTRLLRGRDVGQYDRLDTPPVALINEALANVLFPNEDALGKRLRVSSIPSEKGLEIIGVVETGKYEGIGEDPHPVAFLPIAQTGTSFTTVVVRMHEPTERATKLLRKVVLDLDGELTLFNAGGLVEQLALPLFPARIAAVALGFLGLLAMVLAATGLFALLAYAVARRRREIGIRMALGASAGQVLTAVLRRTLLLCGLGLLLGTMATLAAARLLSAVLYGISPRDPATYATGILLMGGVALLACWNPAARAVRIDPACTLREDG